MTNLSITNTYDWQVYPGSKRLDREVQEHCAEFSRSRCARLIEEGWVLLDGAQAKPSTLVRSGQRIHVIIPSPVPVEVTPQKMSISVVYEDSDLIVVDKPAGLVVHPGPGHPDQTLVNALLAMIPDLKGIGGVQRPGIVHRLDKDTSGLIVVAKTAQAHASLTKQLKERDVKKSYLAVVSGIISSDIGEIDAPIGRHPRHRQRMAIVDNGRQALTRYRVIERYSDSTFVEANPVTGRTHQIRVHLASLGHPLLGDGMYGRVSGILVRHFLHASRLGLYLPSSGGLWREFEAPLPQDLQSALEILQNF